MQEDTNYYLWNKGEEFLLPGSKFFKTTEFQCQCTLKTCKQQKISKTLLSKLIKLRTDINEPLHINSAFRCHEHQQELIAQEVNTVVAKKSSHETGTAVDCKPTRMKMVDFLKMCEKYFYAIGIAKTFLHVDERNEDSKVKIRWNY